MNQLHLLLNNIYSSLRKLVTILSADKKQIMSVEDVAAHFSISQHTIYKYCSKRKIPYRKMGAKNMFIRSEIDEWFMNHSIEIKTTDDIETTAKKHITNK